MRVMGLDIGDKRIGLAVSDELGFTAQGLETYNRTSLDKDIPKLLELFRSWSVQRIVVGLPRNMNGTYGPQTEKVKEFVHQLIQDSELVVTYWDERLTTAAAKRVLIEGNVSRNKRKKSIDRLAAVLILQGYLDNQQYGHTSF
ncbi:MAG: Holliday junction resolvase RuvX [Firmicutes bacterium HGW-Firmicutes-12]|nr:MAG: Holliday junction resolvase RuvX [Firmicutes bacterium HGW-Firmicutes-12]